MNAALNSGHGVFDQMMKKSAPKAAQAAMVKIYLNTYFIINEEI